jgi:hypothetical protein
MSKGGDSREARQLERLYRTKEHGTGHQTVQARQLERLYRTKEHGTGHQTVLRLIRERGLDGAIQQLEAWGMKPEADQ